MILKIHVGGSTQVLKDFHPSFIPTEDNVRGMCNDIAGRQPYTFEVDFPLIKGKRK